jgi:hypothetical protein
MDLHPFIVSKAVDDSHKLPIVLSLEQTQKQWALNKLIEVELVGG